MIGKPYTFPRRIVAHGYHALYRFVLPARFWIADRFASRHPAGFPLPPAKLRFRISESIGSSEFFHVGEEAAGNLQAVLREAGHPISGFTQVLDFGCGCGRILMWLRKQYPEIRWHGTDVDTQAIEWCRKNLAEVDFSDNAPLPPLCYQDSGFDLVYGISVFTHLDESYQRAWLPELHRVLRPGGVLLLTFFSEEILKKSRVAEEVIRAGFVLRTSSKLRGIHPEWYQTAFQSRDWLAGLVSQRFTEVQVVPRGFGSHDVIIARRE